MKEPKINDAVFMGKVTSGVTHDIQNILAIIRESAGLMEDLLLINKDAEFPMLERFQKSLKGINEQTQRGAKLISTLNQFAHSPEKEVADIDLAETAASLAVLIERKIDKQGARLVVENSSSPVRLRTYPLKFDAALFLSLECLMEQMETGATIRLRFEEKENAGKVTFVCEGDTPDPEAFYKKLQASEKYNDLKDALRDLNGCMAEEEKGCGLTLVFSSL